MATNRGAFSSELLVLAKTETLALLLSRWASVIQVADAMVSSVSV